MVTDGAPAHQLITVRNRLLDTFQQRAFHLPVEWPPHSPDLTPRDYFLWGYFKDKVYRTPPQHINDMQERIRNEANLLRENPELVPRVVLEMRRGTNLCELRNGGKVKMRKFQKLPTVRKLNK